MKIELLHAKENCLNCHTKLIVYYTNPEGIIYKRCPKCIKVYIEYDNKEVL